MGLQCFASRPLYMLFLLQEPLSFPPHPLASPLSNCSHVTSSEKASLTFPTPSAFPWHTASALLQSARARPLECYCQGCISLTQELTAVLAPARCSINTCKAPDTAWGGWGTEMNNQILSSRSIWCQRAMRRGVLYIRGLKEGVEKAEAIPGERTG